MNHRLLAYGLTALMTLPMIAHAQIDDFNNPLYQDISIFQGSSITIDKPDIEITILKAPFSIQFYNPLYINGDDPDNYNAIHIAAVTNIYQLDKIKSGMAMEETSVFHGGSGFAAQPHGYEGSLYIANHGSQYLFYALDESRVTIVGKKGKFYKQSFDIDSLFFINEALGNPTIRIDSTTIDTLYLAILNDINKNRVIDDGELHKVVVHLAPFD